MSALYLVNTDRWYTERAVWGIAGLVNLAAAALAASIDVRLAGLVACVGLFSLLDAFTGLCVVSTPLAWLGMPSRLTAPGPRPTAFGVPYYRMRTDSWYLERAIYIVVGVNLTLSAILTLAHSSWWLLFPAFVGTVSVQFSLTGFCPVANVLYLLGFEPRLGPVRAPQRLHAHA